MLRWEQILHMYREGYNKQEIADTLNIKPRSVYTALYQLGVRAENPAGDRAFTAEQVREIRKAHADGQTYRAITERYGVSTGAIRNIAKHKSYKWVE